MQREGGGVDMGKNWNNSLTHFFQLPKIEKSDSDVIMAELKRDMEESWTPSKLVAALDKHIVS